MSEIVTKQYSVNTNLEIGWIESIRIVLFDVFAHRLLIWRALKRDLTAPYKQSILGLFWTFFLPIVPVTAYIFLVKIRVLTVDLSMPYPVYVVIGFTIWMLLMGGITTAIGRVLADRVLITKSQYPMIVSIASGYGALLSETLIRFIFVIIMMILFNVSISWHLLLLPLIILPTLVLSISIGIITATLNIVIRDIKNIVDVIARYGIFISSVVFPLPNIGPLAIINDINILSFNINLVRDWIVLGSIADSTKLLICVGISILLFVLSARLLCRLERRVMEYL